MMAMTSDCTRFKFKWADGRRQKAGGYSQQEHCVVVLFPQFSQGLSARMGGLGDTYLLPKIRGVGVAMRVGSIVG